MTKRDQTLRDAAEDVVDRWLAIIMSSDKDAGWQGSGLSGRLVDFKGELPASSGFSGFSKVWEQTRLLRDFGWRYHVATGLMSQLSEIHREALAIDRAYRGRVKVAYDPFVPDKRVEIRWDDGRIAATLGIPQSTYRRRVHDGYGALMSMMAVAA